MEALRFLHDTGIWFGAFQVLAGLIAMVLLAAVVVHVFAALRLARLASSQQGRPGELRTAMERKHQTIGILVIAALVCVSVLRPNQGQTVHVTMDEKYAACEPRDDAQLERIAQSLEKPPIHFVHPGLSSDFIEVTPRLAAFDGGSACEDSRAPARNEEIRSAAMRIEEIASMSEIEIILIAGSYDYRPLSARTRARYESNVTLAQSRAACVMSQLRAAVGDAKVREKMQAVVFGPQRPRFVKADANLDPVEAPAGENDRVTKIFVMASRPAVTAN